MTIESESRADPGALIGRDDWWGTADITITVTNNDTRGIMFGEIADYKDGRGFVKADDRNTQLLAYALGKFYEARCPVRMTIVQPKTSPVVRYVDVTWELLDERLKWLADAAAATDDPDAPLHAGWWCRWCPANIKNGGHCSLPVQLEESDMGTELSIPSFDIATAEVEKLTAVQDNAKKIKDFLDAVEVELFKRAKDGQPTPGYKVGHGRATRVWTDEDAITKYLRPKLKIDEYAPRKLVSPAQAEKLLGKNAFQRKAASLVATIEGKEKLVKDSGTETKEVFEQIPSFI